MVMNAGYIQVGNDQLYVRVFYDATSLPAGDNQPLVNNADPALGPVGFCLLVVNLTGEAKRMTVGGILGITQVTIPAGNPVTSGPARSRTAAQLASVGVTTRGQAASLFME